MSTDRINLDLIDVPNPCTVPWDSMTGGDVVRHCGQCRQNVYHLSKMTREEAEKLIQQHEGKLCGQFYRRADGSVVTRECAVVRWWQGATSAATLMVMGVLTFFGLKEVFASAPTNSTFSFVGGGICSPHVGSSKISPQNSTPVEVAPFPHTPKTRGESE